MAFKKLAKIAKRFWFMARIRPVLRDSERFFGINIPRIIKKTPKVKDKRLALKSLTADLPRERIARRAIKELHDKICPESYTFRLSRRFPPIMKKRTEIYYDRPSLKDLLELHENRRVKNFLKANNLTLAQANNFAEIAFKELCRNIGWAGLEGLDFEADQLIVDSFSNGKLDLVCVDL